jgi:hypothetical protein
VVVALDVTAEARRAGSGRGENWGCCYIDEVHFEGDELPPRV